MIPFARVLTYNNVIKVGEVQDMSCGIRHVMMLRNNGDLYSIGQNSTSQCGLNNKTIDARNKWNKCTISSVKRIICGGYSSIAITNDNKVMMCGRKSPLNFPNDTVNIYETWTDISDKFSQFNIDTVQIYMSSFNIFVQDGKNLYSMGNAFNAAYSTGSGLTTSSSTFVLVHTDAVKIIKSDYMTVSFIIDSNRDVWGAGTGAYGTFGNGTSKGDILAFQKLTCPIKVNCISVNVRGGALFYGDTSVYMTGSYISGGLGDGNTGNAEYTAFTLNNLIPGGMNVGEVRDGSLQTSPAVSLVLVGDTLWETGYDTYGAGGTGSSTSNRTIFAPLNVQPNLSNSTITATQYTSYVWNEGEVWGSGDPESLPSLTGWFSFTKITLPWEL